MESEYFEKGMPRFISFTNLTEQKCDPCDSQHAPATVVVRDATKSYVRGNNVICGLNMTVKRGTIYSLLGCSGCGKSSTLSCIVGLGKFTSGDVWVFGKKPGSRETGVPGRNIAYMPQDYSLYDEFSISETFKYFGGLNGMDDFEIKSSILFYTKLLQLPKSSSRVGELSGGQKRRVSFAISLQHKPELVILDEPTVGVDPLLRERVWEYLVDLTKTKATVIITTHYIEEARHSDTVGIMHEGRLIAEDSPTILMERFGTNSLEAVVLDLTRSNIVAPVTTETLPQMARVASKISGTSDSFKRIRALVSKNTMVEMRSLTMFLMIIGVPTIGLLSYFVAVGTNPSNVNFGVVNDELANTSATCYDLRKAWNGTCDMNYFSCKYLKHLPFPTFNIKEFHSKEEAEDAVRKGEVWGFLYFPPEFSWYFYERAASGLRADPDNFNQSNIVARLDESNTLNARILQVELFLAYQKFIRDLLGDCDYDPNSAEYPLTYKTPILGEKVESMRDFMTASIFIGVLFFWPIVTTGIRYVSEKRNGTMERSLVAGIRMWEIFLAYSVTEFFIAVLRMLIIYIFTVSVFKMHIEGSLWLMFLLGLLSSYLGVAVGFLFGSFCTEEVQIALLSMAIFLPNMLLSGMCWPTEGMPFILQKISYMLPTTLACEAMRSITSRGWEFSHPNVWPGFAIMAGYMFLFFIAAIIVSSRKFIK